jgi:hypothetical protein
MLLIFEVMDATAMPLCHVGNFQDKAGRLRWRVAVKRKLFCPSRTPLENYRTGRADSLLVLHMPALPHCVGYFCRSQAAARASAGNGHKRCVMCGVHWTCDEISMCVTITDQHGCCSGWKVFGLLPDTRRDDDVYDADDDADANDVT